MVDWNNKEEVKEYNRLYNIAHKNRKKETDKQYYLAHCEERKAKNNIYYHSHHKESLERQHKYYREHKSERDYYSTEWRIINHPRVLLNQRIYRKSHKLLIKGYESKYKIKIKTSVLSHYGNGNVSCIKYGTIRKHTKQG
jgi:hypothetical protein